MLSEPVQIALIVAVPTTLTALGGIYLSYRNGKKADEIKEQTNGHLTRVNEQLKDALATIVILREQLDFVFGDDKAKAARRLQAEKRTQLDKS